MARTKKAWKAKKRSRESTPAPKPPTAIAVPVNVGRSGVAHRPAAAQPNAQKPLPGPGSSRSQWFALDGSSASSSNQPTQHWPRGSYANDGPTQPNFPPRADRPPPIARQPPHHDGGRPDSFSKPPDHPSARPYVHSERGSRMQASEPAPRPPIRGDSKGFPNQKTVGPVVPLPENSSASPKVARSSRRSLPPHAVAHYITSHRRPASGTSSVSTENGGRRSSVQGHNTAASPTRLVGLAALLVAPPEKPPSAHAMAGPPPTKKARRIEQTESMLASTTRLDLEQFRKELEPLLPSQNRILGHEWANISHNYLLVRKSSHAEDVGSLAWGPAARSEDGVSVKHRFYMAALEPDPTLQVYEATLDLDPYSPAMCESVFDVARGLPQSLMSKRLRIRKTVKCPRILSLQCLHKSHHVVTACDNLPHLLCWNYNSQVYGNAGTENIALSTVGDIITRGRISVGPDDGIVGAGVDGHVFSWHLGGAAVQHQGGKPPGGKEIYLPKSHARINATELGEITVVAVQDPSSQCVIAGTNRGNLAFVDFRVANRKGKEPKMAAHSQEITAIHARTSRATIMGGSETEAATGTSIGMFLTGSADNEVRIWDARKLDKPWQKYRHRARVTGVEWSPHVRSLFLSTSRDGVVDIHRYDANGAAVTKRDVQTRVQAHVMHGGAPVVAAAWNPDPRLEGTVVSVSAELPPPPLPDVASPTIQVWRGEGYLDELRRLAMRS
ncbi:hypothetical protein HDU86_004688 [Geranomyces michiganensis]|nr:hypothetical protein HDU86_004688 [Geranomyces michiganensis]